MLTLYDFHRRSSWTVCGLDFLFTLGRTVRGLPLSLYTFPKRAWLGITTQQASPNLTRIHVPVSFRTQPTNTIAVQPVENCVFYNRAKVRSEPDELPLLHPAKEHLV